MYTGLVAELASYGFLVIVLNHNDQSCPYTIGHEQEVEEEKAPESVSGPQVITIEKVTKRVPIMYNSKHEFEDMEFRRLQLQIRENEIEALIKQICGTVMKE